MFIAITDSAHAIALVREGDITHADVNDTDSAILLRDALETRLAELGDCRSCDAIDEGKFLCDQIAALDCDWLDAPSPECEWHLH